jgi:cytochrome c oxidase subunit 2
MPLFSIRRFLFRRLALAGFALVLMLGMGSVAAAQAPTAEAIMKQHGCPGCHVIPGIPEAVGKIGPTLEGLGSRPRIASGSLRNSPENLARWLRNPKAVRMTMMPNTGLTEEEIAVLVRFLESL